MTANECLLTVPEIVRAFNISKTTIYAAMANGTMGYLNDNGVKKTTTACVTAWITAQVSTCAPVSSPDKRSSNNKAEATNEDFYDQCLKKHTHKHRNN